MPLVREPMAPSGGKCESCIERMDRAGIPLKCAFEQLAQSAHNVNRTHDGLGALGEGG